MNGILLASIVTSSITSLGFSEGKRRHMDNLYIIWYNYIATFLISLAVWLHFGTPGGKFSLAALLQPPVLWGPDGPFTLTCLFGLVSGGLYLANFLLLERAIGLAGPGMATLFSKLGMVGLALLTAGLWQETLTPVRLVGIFLACAALFLFHAGGFAFHRMLLLLFLCSGVNEIVKKAYTFYVDMSYQYLYYLVIFSVCLALSTALVLRQNGRPVIRRQEAVLGGAVGCANLSATFTMMWALTVIPASLAFPTQSGGVILLTCAAGCLRYGEPFSRSKAAGLALTVVSIGLMNL